MNTLSFNDFLGRIGSSKQVNAVKNAFLQGKFPLEISGCEGAMGALLLAKIFFAKKGQYFAIVPGENEAENLAVDLSEAGIPSLRFPTFGTVPYSKLSVHSIIFPQRSRALCDIAQGKPGIVIIPQRAFLSHLPPPDYIKNNSFSIKAGDKINTGDIARALSAYGYSRTPRVQLHGEFALRGEVLDICLVSSDEDSGSQAFRVLLDFDRVESIKRLDILLQLTEKEKLNELIICPMKEVIWTDERISVLEKNLAAGKEFTDKGRAVIEELITYRSLNGQEMFFPLAFDRNSSFLDYLGADGTLVLFGRERLDKAQESLDSEYRGMYTHTAREENNFQFPLPQRLLLNFKNMIDSFYNENDGKRLISFNFFTKETSKDVHNFNIPCEPSRSFFGNINYLNEEFSSLFANGWKIIVFAESQVQAERIKSIITPNKSLFVIPMPISCGFSLPDIKIMVIHENEIFGRSKRPVRSLKTVQSSPLDTFIELNPGDYVVHVNHGIGLFKGIERINTFNYERDYIRLEYAGDETVFVPVEQVNLVQRYIGNEGNPPRLDTVGSKSWENRKNRVKQSVEELAQKLLKLYSMRKKAQGFSFSKDSEWQTMFEAAFPFEETLDQLRCVEEIKQDMENSAPMDRLVCGDVGYGKTEVALRACFKAVMDGRQVVFLAPTTILAEQHFENFKERFSKFPVRVAMLSRFVDRKKIKIILEQLKAGQIDLLIGTHRAIQRDVQFKNLGLIVIDEEQRFGVKDKERLKELKTNVDCLTLSATPIPRTLHMSLLKIRDMSLLATPPKGRHPIETVVEEYSDERLVQAIRSEVKRGGQVFFLHNHIETLRETRQQIERLVPEMLVETAHGRMDSKDIEDIMRRFIHGGFHVLVSTTIIENGIDIPNVNTIIIDSANIYGISQLYQLRGRVGRSDRVAYAWLLYPKNKALTELAMKRLQVISDYTDLGSGFKVAMKDMEIRGAGNLLGKEQSGDIYSVGFDLYIKLLDEAVKQLENSEYEAEIETLLELEYTGFIPSNYIDSEQEKMEIYKMIAAIRDKDELERVYAVMQDRFGPVPDEAASLLALAEIRIFCRELGVCSLREKGGIVRIEFAKVAKLNVDRLLRLLKESSGKLKLDPKKPNILLLETGNIGLKEKSEFIKEKLQALI